MRNTETHFGLQNIDGKITADNGESFLPTLQEMTNTEYHELYAAICHWLDIGELSEEDEEDLQEIVDTDNSN